MTATITLRPITDDDQPLLLEIYGSTREDELRLVDWSDAQKQAFVEQQFGCQHAYYQQQYADASFDVILADGVPVGRLYVDRREDEIRIIDIALLPEFRGRGIGGSIMKDLLEEALRAEKPVRIHVENYNPAMRWYDRLGFHKTGETGVYHLMEWVPENTPNVT
jgi:ribosomal protein S18 acetylase RimI-like enzyme